MQENELGTHCGDDFSMNTFDRLGYDEQALAFAGLITSLDNYIKVVSEAESQRAQTEQSVRAVLERSVSEAAEKQTKHREQVESQHALTHSEIKAKFETKLASAKHDRHRAESSVRSDHQSQVSKAKKIRNESVWLAETVLESSLLNEERAHNQLLTTFNASVKNIETLETNLISVIGPAMLKRIAELPVESAPDSESTSIDELNQRLLDAKDAVDAYSSGGLRIAFRGREKKVELAQDARVKIGHARKFAEALWMRLEMEYENRLLTIREKHTSEISKADHTMRVIVQDLDRKAGAAVKEASESFELRRQEFKTRSDRDNDELDRWRTAQREQLEQRFSATVANAHATHDEEIQAAQSDYDSIRSVAESALLTKARPSIEQLKKTSEQAERTNLLWEQMPAADQPTDVPKVLRIVNTHLDLVTRLDQLDQELCQKLGVQPELDVPGVLAMPGPKSLIIRHDVHSRDQALSTMRMAMTRILASFPARKARFVMADPIGIGQSFAGYMRLSDLDPSPVGQRIWADPQHIERQLHDLTEHMQTVIQKYLRADYATIEDYNAAAGEIAEPYRFVIIADLQEALTDIGAARLKSILESGPRCGVYAFLTIEKTHSLPSDLQHTLESTAVELHIDEGIPRFGDERFVGVNISLDAEPDDRLTAEILDRVAAASAEAGRVEVPFDRLAPAQEEIWSRECDDELVVPVGRFGAQKNQELRLGIGTRQHALIAGRTGSGKSTLLHVIITAAGMWYSPDELQMYLIDFKKGVEFKAYTGGRLPHVRAVAIESDREFGLSVLKRLDEELTTRGELFRKLGAQNLQSARELAPDEQLPRLLLLIDEFQEFFTEDDEVSSDATLLLDRLVRQGRAFGVHVVLGSQTLSGAYSLARSTLGQIGVRIALQCSETDSYLILGEDNNAARLLERPGEAIYNNAGGLVEGNSPFQTAWLPDAQREQLLDQLPPDTRQRPQTVVFEGNKPAEFDKSVMAFTKAYTERSVPRLLLGDAVAIAPPAAPSLTRRSGANMLVVSPQPQSAIGMLVSSAITFSMTPNSRVVFIDPTPEDDANYGLAQQILTSKQVSAEVMPVSSADAVVSQINQLVEQRGDSGGDPVLLVLAGLHRMRSLRKNDDYGFSLDEVASSPDKDLANILLEGPAKGVWVAAWCDTLSNLERAMDRSVIREFGLRVLMQMSASDSTMLMDKSTASTLGENRAFLVDDVTGIGVKFRPVQF